MTVYKHSIFSIIMRHFLKLAVLGFVYSASAFDLEDYATTYRATRDAYLKAANELKLATGPYKAARDAYVAATATYTKSLYERRRLMDTDNLSFDDLEKLSENPDMLFNARRRLWSWDMWDLPTSEKTAGQTSAEQARFEALIGDSHYERVGVDAESCDFDTLKSDQQAILDTVYESYTHEVPDYPGLCSLIRQDLVNQLCKVDKYFGVAYSKKRYSTVVANHETQQARRLWMWDQDYICSEQGEWDMKASFGGVADHYENFGYKVKCTSAEIQKLRRNAIGQLKAVFNFEAYKRNPNCRAEQQKAQLAQRKRF